MLLTTTNLVHYLLARGLLTPELVVDGPLRIVDFSRRNRNFKVFLGETSGLFLKQLPEPVESPAGGPSRELACHRLARSRPEYAPLLNLMPRFRDHDPDRRVLTVELIHPGEDLRERYQRLGHPPDSLAKALGQALGRLHALESILTARPDDLSAFPRAHPWILGLVRDVEASFGGMNPAQRELLTAILQSPELSYGLDGLRKAWKSTTLIHGDLKRDNIMVCFRDDDARAEPKFIDWELAEIGDPAWDVAGLWLTFLEPGLVESRSDDPAEDFQAVEFALSGMMACWHEYVRMRHLPFDREAGFRTRCVHYLGAKFLLFAVELLGVWPTPSPTTRRVARLARSIMIDPERFADRLTP